MFSRLGNKSLPVPPKVKSLNNYAMKSEGTCKQGERADLTGCIPANGEGKLTGGAMPNPPKPKKKLTPQAETFKRQLPEDGRSVSIWREDWKVAEELVKKGIAEWTTEPEEGGYTHNMSTGRKVKIGSRGMRLKTSESPKEIPEIPKEQPKEENDNHGQRMVEKTKREEETKKKREAMQKVVDSKPFDNSLQNLPGEYGYQEAKEQFDEWKQLNDKIETLKEDLIIVPRDYEPGEESFSWDQLQDQLEEAKQDRTELEKVILPLYRKIVAGIS